VNFLQSRRSAKPNFREMEVFKATVGGLTLPAIKRRWRFFSKAAADRVPFPETARSIGATSFPQLGGGSAAIAACGRIMTSGRSRPIPPLLRA
jgi:hypothetical protein